ncbi:Putative metallopeptidase, catalytic domain superfamily [Septoria linicola]|uniref:Metallopeptidase, catalytic domain superfamily n=1 Tax=Septoria linicola TaxID=215465 RepID=A0A9Q9AP22_9PEZI|nr:Putative metallopeptidase, catalytic domain superfamily [Septoria linicola]
MAVKVCKTESMQVPAWRGTVGVVKRSCSRDLNVVWAAIWNDVSLPPTALPNPQVAIVTVVPIPAAASPYPSKPSTNEFSYEHYDEAKDTDKADRTTVHNAFDAWSEVLQAAIQSLGDTSDDTFSRWFPSEALLRLFKPDATNPAPQPRVASLINDHNDYRSACGPDKKTKAYFTDDDRFHICPRGLSQVTSAREVDRSKLETQVGADRNSLTGTLIHEFMHWNRVGNDLPRSAGHIVDVQYGAGNCMRMNDGKKKQETFINADSYKWCALNAYYNSRCNKKFGDPFITSEDFEESSAELEESPLYDPALSSGSLASV